MQRALDTTGLKRQRGRAACRLLLAQLPSSPAFLMLDQPPPSSNARPQQILAWSLNFGACFGGNGTLIGASANIVTATLAERAGERITFLQWLKAGIPVTIVSRRGAVVCAAFWHNTVLQPFNLRC